MAITGPVLAFTCPVIAITDPVMAITEPVLAITGPVIAFPGLELEFGAVLSNLKHTQHTHKPQRPIDSSLWPTTIDMIDILSFVGCHIFPSCESCHMAIRVRKPSAPFQHLKLHEHWKLELFRTEVESRVQSAHF